MGRGDGGLEQTRHAGAGVAWVLGQQHSYSVPTAAVAAEADAGVASAQPTHVRHAVAHAAKQRAVMASCPAMW